MRVKSTGERATRALRLFIMVTGHESAEWNAGIAFARRFSPGANCVGEGAGSRSWPEAGRLTAGSRQLTREI